jgi:hypothetical protein
MTWFFRGVSQSLQGNVRIVSEIMAPTVTFNIFLIHSSLIILSFDTVWLRLLTASLSKPQMHRNFMKTLVTPRERIVTECI